MHAKIYHLPMVAYSGELDIQKQAADIMEEALKQEGMRLTHIIGPKTKHAIHKDSKIIIETKMNALSVNGRDRSPRDVRLVTYTLKYNRMHWITVEGLEEHWTRAQVSASARSRQLQVATQHVTDLRFSFPAGNAPFNLDEPVMIELSSDADRFYYEFQVRNEAALGFGGVEVDLKPPEAAVAGRPADCPQQVFELGGIERGPSGLDPDDGSDGDAWRRLERLGSRMVLHTPFA